ncbi:MAG TPA: hypothetical protein VF988_00310, partial [Verrucomicrobiae bacterium]
KFLLRTALLGLAGFAFYAMLPTANGLMPHSPWNLGTSWHNSLHQSKNILSVLYNGFWRSHRMVTLAVLIYYLVPSLPLLVRKRDEGTHDKLGVDQFQIWLYRSLRIGLLFACVWLAFNPTVGPQHVAQHELGLALPMLSFAYLNALGAAYLAGNFLLVSQLVVQAWPPRRIQWRPLGVPIGAAGVALLTAALMLRNAPAIVQLNSHSPEKYGVSAMDSLPGSGGVVLGDFSQELILFRAALAHRSDAAKWQVVDSRQLPGVDYRAELERQHPSGWLSDQTRHELTPVESVWLLDQVARSNRVFYLNPSYGYFFEHFYLTPIGAVYEVKPRGKDPLDLPAMAGETLKANEDYWTKLWDRQLAGLIPPPPHRLGAFEKRLKRIAIIPVPPDQSQFLRQWYSMALDGWAVTLQKQGHLPEAQTRLQQALLLNTNNLSARITLSCNLNLQTNAVLGLTDVTRVASLLGSPSRVNLLLNNGGPIDEPTMDYLVGSVFIDWRLSLQAAEQFERVRRLAPHSLAAELALAEIYNRLQMPDRGRPIIEHLRAEFQKLPATNSSLDLNLALLDSYSWLLETNVSNARNALESVIEQHPDDAQVKNRVLAAYVALGDYTNALHLIELQLAKTPDSVPLLNSKAAVLIQCGRSSEAVPLLNDVLLVTNLPIARANRAMAQLTLHNYDAAEIDLRELDKSREMPGMVNLGLATIAENRRNTNQALQYLQICLSNAPAGSPLWRQASQHLAALQSATNSLRGPATLPRR